jgi:KipI family sensor histidine kinase inhibitor
MGRSGVTILPMGERAVLIELDGIVPAVFAGQVTGELDGLLDDVVPAARTVLLRFVDRPPPGLGVLLESLAAAVPVVGTPAERLVEIDVRYDGDDLAEVAGRLGLSVDDVVEIHSAAEYRVEFCGFAPGFAYLGGLPESLHLPRRATPRVRVPAGSIAIAAGYSAVYPSASPGGWHLIGSTRAVVWNLDRSPPSSLEPGDAVRFRPQ